MTITLENEDELQAWIHFELNNYTISLIEGTVPVLEELTEEELGDFELQITVTDLAGNEKDEIFSYSVLAEPEATEGNSTEAAVSEEEEGISST